MQCCQFYLSMCQSHPAWVRGLKHGYVYHKTSRLRASHPAWVRGLKQNG